MSQSGTQVSGAEGMLFERWAPVVRQLGRASEAVEEAARAARAIADGIRNDAVDFGEADSGTFAADADEMAERTARETRTAKELHRSVATKAIELAEQLGVDRSIEMTPTGGGGE